MGRRTTTLLKAGLSALHFSGASGLVSPLTRGVGVVFMMHRVSPEPVQAFEPNRILRVTPQFLEAVVRHVIERGFEVISMGELPARLSSDVRSRPFACFTFDDGYRDNAEYAFPILRRYRVPHTLYVPTDYPDGRGDLWWLVLEAAIRKADRVAVPFHNGPHGLSCRTVAEKERAFHTLYWHLRGLPEQRAREIVGGIAQDSDFDSSTLCADLIMNWDELRVAAKDPLLTIGAHTCRHLALSRISISEAREEMAQSSRRIEVELGRPCRHFSYPYGCDKAAGAREFALAQELGFETAVTTRKGLVHPSHAASLNAIPRLSLNGDFQDLRYVDAMLSGVPFSMWNTLRRAAGAEVG
ncbi:MAG: polysaccharide deacetylase [Hyphomicrobium sp.]|nr:MAG: polysaccharide deacetylase [Hyphomicrobium sp.]